MMIFRSYVKLPEDTYYSNLSYNQSSKMLGLLKDRDGLRMRLELDLTELKRIMGGKDRIDLLDPLVN